MILYNVTVKVDHSILEDWKNYMLNGHIQAVIDTGCFEQYRISKLLYIDETDGVTFSIQYLTKDVETLEKYQKNFAPALQKDHVDKFGDKALAFRTIMELLEEK